MMAQWKRRVAAIEHEMEEWKKLKAARIHPRDPEGGDGAGGSQGGGGDAGAGSSCSTVRCSRGPGYLRLFFQALKTQFFYIFLVLYSIFISCDNT